MRASGRTVAAMPRMFALWRHHDVSGISGTGVVAYGTQYPPSGAVTLAWLGHTSGHRSIAIYDGIAAVRAIHGHHGQTEIVWITGAYGGGC